MALRDRSLRLFVRAAVLAAMFSAPAGAETRSYVIEWFSLASSSQDGDCPGGVNLPTREQYFKSFELLGKTPEEAKQLMADFAQGGIKGANVRNMLRMRGRLNGEPMNAFVYPWTVADPKLRAVVSKVGLGFNLDGKEGPNSFQDPITKETGVDNELFRALGCIEQFRGTYDYRPTFWAFIWGSMKETTPAWLFSVDGDNLDQDGPVTITFDRAIEHQVFGATGDATADVTYRIDPDPRSHHVFKGEIRNGELSITTPGDLVLLLDTLSFTELRLHRTHLRLRPRASGNLEGIIGGYQPWGDIYFAFAQGGLAYEGMILNDTPGIYYLLKKHADAEPDPKTGQNTAISATYRIEAVPVFAVPADAAAYKAGANR